MKIISVLSIFFLFQISFAETQLTGTPSELREMLLQQDQQQMQRPPQCMDFVANALSQGLGSSYQAYSNHAQTLIDNADKAFTAAKDCQTNLRQHWLNFQSAKTENNKQRALLATSVAKAESEYRMKIIELKQECDDRADQQWQEERNLLYSQPLNDPTKLANFNETLNARRGTLFRQCYQGKSLNRELVAELGNQLKIRIGEINAEMKASNDALNDMRVQVAALQEDELVNCKRYQDFRDYSDKLSAKVTSQGRTLAAVKNTFNYISTVQNCIDPGSVNRGVSSDTTNSGF